MRRCLHSRVGRSMISKVSEKQKPTLRILDRRQPTTAAIPHGWSAPSTKGASLFSSKGHCVSCIIYSGCRLKCLHSCVVRAMISTSRREVDAATSAVPAPTHGSGHPSMEGQHPWPRVLLYSLLKWNIYCDSCTINSYVVDNILHVFLQLSNLKAIENVYENLHQYQAISIKVS